MNKKKIRKNVLKYSISPVILIIFLLGFIGSMISTFFLGLVDDYLDI